MEYLIHIAILFSIYAILALSLNLVVGYTGLLSLCHAAFFGIGAYATALLTVTFAFPFVFSVATGIVIAALSSLLIGLVLSRLASDYYMLGTVGFNYIVFSILLNLPELTRGPLGIPSIPRPNFFGIPLASNLSFLALAALIMLLIYIFSRFIVRSSFGRAIRAIREDEAALQVFGYRTLSYKLAVFAIAAGIAAVAGSLFASYLTFIDPSMFTVMESVFILALVILGGLANLKGSLLGALVLIFLPEALRFVGFPSDVAGQMRQAVYGLILVFLMLYRPQGLMGEYRL